MRAKTNWKRHTPGKMNALETAYAQLLEQRKKRGEILDWAFEPVKLKLRDCYYTPDFRIIGADEYEEFHDTKARHQFYEKGVLKIKLAAEMHPYTFKKVEKKAKEWVVTEV